jgi:guanylate kinase
LTDRLPPPKPARLVVLSGPSGVGKSSVIADVRERFPQVWLSVSATTRPPRPGEVEGEHYHFVDDHGFDRLVAEDALLEYATFAGFRYGTPRAPVEEHLAAGTPVLLEIELQGARQVRVAMPESLLVFLAPPSWDELVRRLTGRGTEDPEVVRRRLDAARIELAAEDEFDEVILNSSVREASDRLVALIGIP